ncbi:MAG: DUF2062 domain-containing protein [Cytophagaceae bacterium]
MHPPETVNQRRSFFKRKLLDPVLNFLKQGMTPSSLALAFSLGIVIAVIPIFGSTTLLCFAAVFFFRVNTAAIMLANYFVYPLQFVLFIPFIRIGEWIFNAPPLHLSVTEIFELVSSDPMNAVSDLWWSTLYALVAWCILAVPVCMLLYVGLKYLLAKIAEKFALTA